MATELRLVQPGGFTRTVYVVGMAFLILQFLAQVPGALLLVGGTATNPNAVNPVIALVSLVVALVVTWLLGGRCIGVIRNRALLDAYGGDPKLSAIRALGLTLVTFGLLVTVLVVGSMFLVEGGGQLLIARAFGFTVPLGLALFEFSRLLGLERAAFDSD